MKILIIEDEKELAQNMADYLLTENYLCEFAAAYEQTLKKSISITTTVSCSISCYLVAPD